MEINELISNFDRRLTELGISDDYRELLVSNVKQHKSIFGKVNTVMDILNNIDDKLSKAALKESFPEIDENAW